MKMRWHGLPLTAALTLVALGARAETVTLAPLKDNSMYAESPALSNGQGTGIFSGRTNDGFERRALIAKILAHLEKTVPDQFQAQLPLGARAPPLQASLI